MSNLGIWSEQQGDLEGAEEWFRKAADAGSVSGMKRLAARLESRGAAEEAVIWRQMAAERNDQTTLDEIQERVRLLKHARIAATPVATMKTCSRTDVDRRARFEGQRHHLAV